MGYGAGDVHPMQYFVKGENPTYLGLCGFTTGTGTPFYGAVFSEHEGGLRYTFLIEDVLRQYVEGGIPVAGNKGWYDCSRKAFEELQAVRKEGLLPHVHVASDIRACVRGSLPLPKIRKSAEMSSLVFGWGLLGIPPHL